MTAGDVEFTKLHGDGNDFVVVDEHTKTQVKDDGKSGFAARYCRRRTGVGCDGVAFLDDDTDSDVRMQLYQPDGDPVEMCGNALRCVARYLVEEDYYEAGESFTVETPAGEREVSYSDGRAVVEMGESSFDADDVPVDHRLVDEEILGYRATAVNTGVPHAVVFVDDVDGFDVEEVAPRIRHADVFPEGANVDFVERGSDGVYRYRTFERGVEGETRSCGTGAVAVAAVARLLDHAGDSVETETQGGELSVSFEDDVAYLRGDVERVFQGSIDR